MLQQVLLRNASRQCYKIKMQHVSAIKIPQVPLSISTIIYSRKSRKEAPFSSKNRSKRTCDTKISSVPKRIYSSHKSTIKNDNWKYETIKREKRTNSFSKQLRFSLPKRQSTINMIKSHKHQNPSCIYDSSAEILLQSPCTRSMAYKNSIFQETRFSKPSKFQVCYDSRETSAFKQKDNQNLLECAFNKTLIILNEYKKKCRKLTSEKQLYSKRLDKALKKIKTLQGDKKKQKKIKNKQV